LWEATAGQLGKAPAAATHELPGPSAAAAVSEEEEDDDELEKMQSRLQALKS